MTPRALDAGTAALPVALFCRPPVPGKTKTRLIPAVGAAQAAALARAFFVDVLESVAREPALAPSLWWAEPPTPGDEIPSRAASFTQAAQHGETLGDRMADALDVLRGADGRGESNGAAAILGTDAPTLPSARVVMAGRLLAGEADVVLGPSSDGGYYLVAAKVPMQSAFAGVRWSSADTLADTVERVHRCGYRLALLPPWYDVDTARDLALLRTHLQLCPTAAPHTAALLASI